MIVLQKNRPVQNKTKTALIQSVAPRVALFAQRTIETLGHRCLLAKDKMEARLALIREPVDLLICNIQDKNEDFDLFDFARKTRPHCRGIAVIDQGLEKFFPQLLVRGYPLNLIADNRPIDTIELAATIQKILTGDIFGMEKYGIPVEDSFQLEASSQKYTAIETIQRSCENLAISPRLIENLELILNELIMNAIFDAPVNKRGKRIYYQKSRAKELLLKPQERPRVEFGHSPSLLAVSVSDPFGSFKEKTFFSYVERCFAARSPGSLPKKAIGLGLYMVYRSLHQMVINVDFGHRTEVIAIIDFQIPRNEIKRFHHSFHFFSIGAH